jgi:hypothetical protein
MIEFNLDSQGLLHFRYDPEVGEALSIKMNEADQALCLAANSGLQLQASTSVLARHPFAHLLVAYRKGLASAHELGDTPLALAQLSKTNLKLLFSDRLFVDQDLRLLPQKDTRQQSFELVPIEEFSEKCFHMNLDYLSNALGASWTKFIGVLRTITFVNIASIPGLRYFSGSWNLTFGAMHMIYTESLPTLAECLTHEAAHTWLSLIDDSDKFARSMWDETSTWSSPWREDPRPIGGIVHGVFVFSCVFVVLGALSKYLSASSEIADIRKRMIHIASQVAEGLEVLRASRLLTDEGEQLCQQCEARLNDTFAALDDKSITADANIQASYLRKTTSFNFQ